MSKPRFLLVSLPFILMSCSSNEPSAPISDATISVDIVSDDASKSDSAIHSGPGGVLSWEAQRSGDPDVGYQVLLNGNYVGCGIPARVYELAKELNYVPGGTPAPDSPSDLPYYLSLATDVSDIDLVSPNCLTCHAGTINGQLVVGLGSTDLDYTSLSGSLAGIDQATIALLDDLFGLSEEEFAELTKFTTRTQAIQDYITPRTAGVNPADNLAAILFAHRDQDTLAWSDDLLMEPPPKEVVPLDVPPWWRMKKKSSMLYNGAGRGDHARIMMTASTLCIDTVEAAQKIDATMPDLRAFILSIEAPSYPWEVDSTLADAGEVIFNATCSSCHGTYGEEETYPNLYIPADEVGTDPALATGASQFATRFVDWFNASFYGENSRLEPQDGYVPPPLDGIWATPPFLHNGSVPTLEALLDSSKRPTYWKRSFSSYDYDTAALGWNYTELDYGQADEPNPQLKRVIYDTTLYGYGNQGHTYGDHLSAEDRLALLEYLKTL